MSGEGVLHQWIVGSIKAVEWEKAKGQLRAVVAAGGSLRSIHGDERYVELSKKVEAFIDDVEGEGLHE